jgi:hypothetical protein
MENHSFQLEKLQEKITKKRNELLRLGNNKGLENKSVLECSQELDLLIYQVQVLDKQETKNISHNFKKVR